MKAAVRTRFAPSPTGLLHKENVETLAEIRSYPSVPLPGEILWEGLADDRVIKVMGSWRRLPNDLEKEDEGILPLIFWEAVILERLHTVLDTRKKGDAVTSL